jgi:hypothetical protein
MFLSERQTQLARQAVNYFPALHKSLASLSAPDAAKLPQ